MKLFKWNRGNFTSNLASYGRETEIKYYDQTNASHPVNITASSVELIVIIDILCLSLEYIHI